MQIDGHDIGVCGWSLRPTGAADLIAKVRQLQLEHVQIALLPLLEMDEAQRAGEIKLLKESRLAITGATITFTGEDYGTMGTLRATAGLVPDEHWPARRELAARAGTLAAEMGIKFVEFHIGFIPASNDKAYNVLVDRVCEIAKWFARDGVNLLMETGQEAASELLQFINDANCRNLAVNFDPANMVLYGTDDPIGAVEVLNRHIQHVHLKDATESEHPRVQWGKEVPLGAGQVDFDELLDALDSVNYSGALCIERDMGNDRLGDIRSAIQFLRGMELSPQ